MSGSPRDLEGGRLFIPLMDNYSPLCTYSLAADDEKIVNENHGWDLRQKFLCTPRLTENKIPVGIIKGERRNRIRDDPRALIERETSIRARRLIGFPPTHLRK